MDYGRRRQELRAFGYRGSCSSACHGCLGAEVALNSSDIPLPKLWLQGLSVCLSRWEMSVLGSSFGAWDPLALGKPQEGADQEGGSAWTKKITFWLCPMLPEHRARGVAPVCLWAAVSSAMPIPWLGWDMGNAATRPPSCARRGTRCGTRSNQFVIAFCTAGAMHPTWGQCARGGQESLPKHPNLVAIAGSKQPGGHTSESSARVWAGSSQLSAGPFPGRVLLRAPSLSLLAHLHDILNYGGPSGELVGLLTDPLLALRLAPAAQGGLGGKSTETP